MNDTEQKNSLLNTFFLSIAFFLYSLPTHAADNTLVNDPYEKFNRPVFQFNDALDTYLLKPIAKGYNAIMPKPLNEGVHNFFNNINTLPTIANDLLQFNFYQATNDLWRFGINTTIGIVGFFDIASRMNLKPYSNDFGLTLATWGYKNSNYLVLPFFGPSTPRDGIGLPVDYFAFSIYPYVEPTSTRYALYSLGVVDKRAQLLKVESVMEEAAIDKYAFVRSAYMQRRAFQIKQNEHLGYMEREKDQEPLPNTPGTEATAGEIIEVNASDAKTADNSDIPSDMKEVSTPTHDKTS